MRSPQIQFGNIDEKGGVLPFLIAFRIPIVDPIQHCIDRSKRLQFAHEIFIEKSQRFVRLGLSDYIAQASIYSRVSNNRTYTPN